MSRWANGPFRYHLIGLVQGSAEEPYEVVVIIDTRDETRVLGCSCPAYKFNRQESKTCKHLRGFSVDDAEIDFPMDVVVPEQQQPIELPGMLSYGYGDLMKPGGSVTAQSPLLIAHDWGAEEKYDGISGILVFDADGQMHAFSPSRDVTHCLPPVEAKSLAGYAVQVEYLNGSPSTSSNVATLLSNGGWRSCERPGLAVLDVLHPSLANRPLVPDRDHWRRMVGGVLSVQVPIEFRVIVPVIIRDDKRSMVEYLRAQGREGVVLKRLTSTYKSGYSPEWLKLKFDRTVDCIVRSYHGGSGKYAGTVGSLVLELLRDGKYVPIGSTSGMSDKQRDFFRDAIDAGQVFVVEVRFQNWTGGGQVRHPRFLRVREDKIEAECIWEVQGPEGRS